MSRSGGRVPWHRERKPSEAFTQDVVHPVGPARAILTVTSVEHRVLKALFVLKVCFHWSPLRAVSQRLIPFVFVLYLVSYLDRVNVAFAALEMNRDFF